MPGKSWKKLLEVERAMMIVGGFLHDKGDDIPELLSDELDRLLDSARRLSYLTGIEVLGVDKPKTTNTSQEGKAHDNCGRAS